MKNKNLIYILLAGVALYLIMKQQQVRAASYPTRPAAPAGSPEWIQWVNIVVSAAGGLANALFGPGGPFEKENKEKVKQAIAASSPVGPGGIETGVIY